MTPPAPGIRPPRPGLARAGAVLLAAVLSVVPLGPAATALAAAPVGYVRLAHLSPDTPAVDVYLSKATAGAEPQVFRAVGYGQLSPYLPTPAGRYAVAMRKAGAPADQPPVLTTEVAVTAGQAYTVAGVGRYADLGLRVLDDDLTAPPDGRAKVRVVQASVKAPVLDVAAENGPTVATGVQFGTTTGYADVQPGSWRLQLSPPGARPTSTDVTLAGGAVYSLLVLDADGGGLRTELRTDARGGTVVPAGGVAAGGGGTAPGGGSRLPLPLALGALALLAAAGLAAAAGPAIRRRARTTW
ncbi:DUF4397 domain-containing protein [Plantactinospora sp. KBS50]|uniref:DUF4397 domain-containing protein n=1 Tax=Plantactinospora sp. KBS50 TaxID=2024580 RepID=UPI000BAB19B3|nr:DUF4397 domain-containing protein [Plantactinospora sp. KBS50]ASW56063.1 hypothetical protein CIK06_20610 [Plantactinospora sp. KBS50]